MMKSAIVFACALAFLAAPALAEDIPSAVKKFDRATLRFDGAAFTATIDRAYAHCKDAWGRRETEIVRCTTRKVEEWAKRSAPLYRDLVTASATRVREIAAQNESGLLTVAEGNAEIKKEGRRLLDDIERRRGAMCPLATLESWSACLDAKMSGLLESGCKSEHPATPSTMKRCFEPIWPDLERLFLFVAWEAGSCDVAREMMEEKFSDVVRKRADFVRTTVKEKMEGFRQDCPVFVAASSEPGYFARGFGSGEDRAKMDSAPPMADPNYEEGPRPGVIWADRLPAQPKPGFFARVFGNSRKDLGEYEPCLHRLVKDAKTSEAAKIGEQFCQEQYKPGLFDRLFK